MSSRLLDQYVNEKFRLPFYPLKLVFLLYLFSSIAVETSDSCDGNDWDNWLLLCSCRMMPWSFDACKLLGLSVFFWFCCWHTAQPPSCFAPSLACPVRIAAIGPRQRGILLEQVPRVGIHLRKILRERANIGWNPESQKSQVFEVNIISFCF